MSLAQQQQALLVASFSRADDADNYEETIKNDTNNIAVDACPDSVFALNVRSFLACRTYGLKMARRALLGLYPVVCQLLDDESFSALAAALWQAHPPKHGDQAQLGVPWPILCAAARNWPTNRICPMERMRNGPCTS